VVVSSAVEGIVDEAVAVRLIAHAGGEPGSVYGKSGKARLLERLQGYNEAARHLPYLSVSANRVPREPEEVPDPKQALVNIARRSRNRAIRQDMVPREGSGRPVGPALRTRAESSSS